MASNSAEDRFDGNVWGNCNSRPKRRLLHRFRARLCDDLLLTTQGLEWWGVLRDGLVQRADVRSDHGHRDVRCADLGIDSEQGGDGWRGGHEHTGGDSCGASCLASYPSGSAVTLTAAPMTNSIFTGWSGAACVGTDVCTVTMSDITMVTATFDVPAPLTLTVVRAGTGSGTVTITQGDIACEITCSASYDNGTVVTLTASARYGVFLQRLERRGRSGRGSCTVVVSAATTVTATFNFRRNRGHRGLDGSRSNCEGSRFDDVVCTLNLQVFFAQKRAVKMDHL